VILQADDDQISHIRSEKIRMHLPVVRSRLRCLEIKNSQDRSNKKTSVE
jgi:hypothetical protein